MPLSQYFRLMDTMARMALRADAARFFLGYIWWLLEPLMWVLVLYVVFEKILVSQTHNFLIFLVIGQFLFGWFSKSVVSASSSIINGKGLVGRVNIPKTLFPMAVIQEGLYRQVAVFAMLFGFLIINGYKVTALWWCLVPVILVNYVLIIACSLIGACLVCMARDFVQIIALGMMFLMFMSGIFWDVHEFSQPDKINWLLVLNPLAFVIDAYRQILMFDTLPDMRHLLLVGGGSAALAGAMVLIMRRGSQYLALKAITA